MVPTHGLPFLMREGLEVCVVPPQLTGPRWRKVRSVANDSLVTLCGVSTLDEASKLVGKSILVRTDDLPHAWELGDVDALVGREVRDERYGELGRIASVMRTPAHDVWVVEGDYGEVLVPVTEPIVVGWGQDGPLEVNVPRGLVGTEALGEAAP